MDELQHWSLQTRPGVVSSLQAVRGAPYSEKRQAPALPTVDSSLDSGVNAISLKSV